MSTPIPRALSALMLFALLAACTAPGPRGVELPAAPGGAVPLDALVYGVPRAAPPAPGVALDALARLEVAGRFADAERAVLRDPAPVAAGLARGAADGRTLRLAASAYERALSLDGADGGWLALHSASDETARERTERFQQHRARLLDALARGDLAAARALVPLPSAGPGTPEAVRRVDACALESQVLLALGALDDAAARCAEGAGLAGASRPFERSRLLLLQAAVEQRRDGEARAETWRAAVSAALTLPELADPVFWRRAAELRPVGSAWPAELAPRAAQALGLMQPPAPDDALVGGWVAAQELAAERAQDALLAASRAAGDADGALLRGTLRRCQARALVALGRPADALALLTQLAADPEPGVRLPALGLLGALELKLARPERARALLAEALADDTPWTERTEAQANLGLTLLLLGDEDAGLARLHEAQALFSAEHAHAALERSLRNELAYTTQARLHEQSASIRARLEALRRR